MLRFIAPETVGVIVKYVVPTELLLNELAAINLLKLPRAESNYTHTHTPAERISYLVTVYTLVSPRIYFNTLQPFTLTNLSSIIYNCEHINMTIT